MSLRWLAIDGDNLTAAAVRTAVGELGLAVVGDRATFTLRIEEREGPIIVDSVDSPFERLLVRHLRACGGGTLHVQDEGGVRSDAEVRIVLPPIQVIRVAVCNAIVRAFSEEQTRWEGLVAANRTPSRAGDLPTPRAVLAGEPSVVDHAKVGLRDHWFRWGLGVGLGATAVVDLILRALFVLLLTAATASAQGQPVTVRDSTSGAVVPDIGSTASKAMRIVCVSGCGGGSGGTSSTDEGAFTFGVDNLTPIGGVYDNTPSLLTEGMVGVGRVSANRHLLTYIGDGSGNERWADVSASGALEVTCDNCGGSTFADNSAFTFNTTPVLIAGYVFDDVAVNAVTENRAAAPRMSGNRVPYGILRDAAGNERGANVTAQNELLVELGAGTAVIGVLGPNSGVDIGDVTINNASGASAVNIQDGGNTITVDGNVGISGVVQTVATLQSAAVANGNGSAITTTSNALLSIQIDCSGCAGGTTVSFEVSYDSGTNYVPFRMRRAGTTTFATSTTVAGITGWEAPLLATTRIRTPISNYSAGTITTLGKIGGTGAGPNATESVIRDAAGNDRGANVTAGGALVVDGSASTQPVSGTVTVTDGAGALNVIVDSGTLTAVTTITNPVTVTDGAGALNVIVDSSALPSGAATSAIQTDGTQKTQIVDSGGTVVNATGTSLDVNCTGGCGGAAAFEDNDPFTAGTTTVAITGLVFDDASPNLVTEDSAGAPRMSENRVAYQQIRDAAGNERGANVTAANALKVDNSGVTQPVSGTVTVTDGAGALNVIVDSGTLTAVTSITNAVTVTDGAGALNTIVDSGTLTAVTTVTNPVTVEGAAADGAAVAENPVRIGGKDGSGNTQDIITDAAGELQVDVLTLPNVTIGTFPDNEPFNVAQINGVTPLMGNGVTGTGSLRVTIASDNTAFTTNVGTFPDNEPFNVAQIAGTATTVNNGTAGAGSQRGVVASDNSAIANWGHGATGAAAPSGATQVGGRTSGADTTGLLTALTICTDHAAVDIVTATTTLIVTGVANRHVRICAINLVSAGANNVALIAGTGATCGTSTAGINGGTTAAEGWNFAANGGISQGSGIGEIMSTKVTGGATGDSVCIITSAAVQLSGTISYAIY